MTDAPHSTRRSQRSHEDAIAKLAKQTHTDVDVVRNVYDEEMAALQSEAAVKGFVGVIVARRVRQRLRSAGNAPAAS
jgi:hypothetical protein